MIFRVVTSPQQPEPSLKLVDTRRQAGEVPTEARALEVLGGFLSYWLVDCKLAGVKLLVKAVHIVCKTVTNVPYVCFLDIWV